MPTKDPYNHSPMALKALFLLRQNIESLLASRKESQTSLAQWAGHDKSWLNKILKGERSIQVDDLDRIADFFGLATYQLFQPGIGALTERRVGADRRSGRERRIGHPHRLMHALALELETARDPTAGPFTGTTDLPKSIRDYLVKTEKDLARLWAQEADAKRQAGAAHPLRPARRRQRRGPDQSDAGPSGKKT